MQTKRLHAPRAAARATTAVVLWSLCVVSAAAETIDGSFERAFAVDGDTLVLDVRTGSGRIAVTAGEPGRVRVSGPHPGLRRPLDAGRRGRRRGARPGHPGRPADRADGRRPPRRAPAVVAAPAGRRQLRGRRPREHPRPGANRVRRRLYRGRGRPGHGEDRVRRHARVGRWRRRDGRGRFRQRGDPRGRRRCRRPHRLRGDPCRAVRGGAACPDRERPDPGGGRARGRVAPNDRVRRHRGRPVGRGPGSSSMRAPAPAPCAATIRWPCTRCGAGGSRAGSAAEDRWSPCARVPGSIQIR